MDISNDKLDYFDNELTFLFDIIINIKLNK